MHLNIKRRYLIAICLLILIALPTKLGDLTRSLVTDAYIQVSAFVAFTLLIFYFSEKIFNFNIGSALKKATLFQIPISALLGATPGCGGAVVVVAAYTSGNVSFGAVLATLTATMGDAAFLLIAVKPEVAMLILPMSLCTGIVTGFIADQFISLKHETSTVNLSQTIPLIGHTRYRDFIFCAIIIPGFLLGLFQILQYDMRQLFGSLPEFISIAGVTTAIFIWSTSKIKTMTNPLDKPLVRVSEETSFITMWVVAAYIAYDYLIVLTPLNLESLFDSMAIFLPIIAILIGFIPGCGPQVLVTTLFINGIIPFSALLGNAISNDGDALFPAIAIAPKAAILATLYSAIPALILAYSVYFLFPNLGQFG